MDKRLGEALDRWITREDESIRDDFICRKCEIEKDEEQKCPHCNGEEEE